MFTEYVNEDSNKHEGTHDPCADVEGAFIASFGHE
jgi:hypothetical protein